jgi:hypothetical protein
VPTERRGRSYAPKSRFRRPVSHSRCDSGAMKFGRQTPLQQHGDHSRDTRGRSWWMRYPLVSAESLGEANPVGMGFGPLCPPGDPRTDQKRRGLRGRSRFPPQLVQRGLKILNGLLDAAHYLHYRLFRSVRPAVPIRLRARQSDRGEQKEQLPQGSFRRADLGPERWTACGRPVTSRPDDRERTYAALRAERKI